jgi:DNA-binding CsgD family transcriptional regulator
LAQFCAADRRARLLMSLSTVKTHLEHTFTETGVRNRSELTAEVVRRRAADQGR